MQECAFLPGLSWWGVSIWRNWWKAGNSELLPDTFCFSLGFFSMAMWWASWQKACSPSRPRNTRFLSWGLSAQGGWGLRRETGDEASFPTRWPGQGRWVLVEAVKSCMILFYFIFFLIGSFACSPGNTYGLCFLSNKIPNHGATGLASGWQCSQIETSWGECLVSHIIFTKQNRQVLIVAWESPVTLNPPELRRIHFIELYNDSPTGAAG